VKDDKKDEKKRIKICEFIRMEKKGGYDRQAGVYNATKGEMHDLLSNIKQVYLGRELSVRRPSNNLQQKEGEKRSAHVTDMRSTRGAHV